MIILSVNAGSSSLKFQAYKMPEESVIVSGIFERIGVGNSFYTINYNGEKKEVVVHMDNHEEAVEFLVHELLENKIVDSLNEIRGIGHRIVHGGPNYSQSVVITDKVIKDIEELSSLAPLHNPAHLLGIKAFIKKIPDVFQVAVFDTAFHQTMEPEKYIYPAPYEWYKEHGIRKYGFHGTSHKFLSEQVASILGKNEFKAIICHLGNGGSITAVKDGKCINTSMGFTPNAGIMMGTRAGDIDVSILPYLMKRTNQTIEEVVSDLNKKSGLAGISGIGSDARDIVKGVLEKNEKAILARDMFVNAIIGYIGKYFMELGGADIICFSAGIGEKCLEMRTWILEALHPLGIEIDYEANKQRGVLTKLSTDSSKVLVYVIPTDEEVMIARDTYKLI